MKPSRPGPVSPCNEYGKVKRLDTIEAIGEKDFPAWFDLPCEEAQCTRIADYILKEEPYPLKAVVGFGLNHRMWPEPEHFQMENTISQIILVEHCMSISVKRQQSI